MALICCAPLGAFLCPEDRPSPIFTVFTVCINSVSAVMAVLYVAGEDAKDCSFDKLKTWLYIALLISMVNIAFALYLYWRICVKVKQMSITSVVWKLLAYDVGVCLYMCFFIFMIVWCSLGGKWGNDKSSWESDDAAQNEACEATADNIVTVVVIFVLYMVLGGCVMLFSLFTECCREPRWKHQQPPQQAQQHQAGGSCWPFSRKNRAQGNQGHSVQEFSPQAHQAPANYPQVQHHQQAPANYSQAHPHQPPASYPPQQAGDFPVQASHNHYANQQQQVMPPQQAAPHYYANSQSQPPPLQQPNYPPAQPQPQEQQKPSIGEKVGHAVGAGIGKLLGGRK
ncbi:(UPF0182) [Diplonema papillatum]|nr:(UPF0182) [Diplonema papillatum]